ncbi:malectin-like [Adelges cooleyi]|uniref:malectin-like n=1 Tax=Adelges cooleyi TaxID=133065 RepID=UPI00217F7066|nr:malectin-like [Adelges cooleyi]
MGLLVQALILIIVNVSFHCLCINPADVIFAVNAGGEEHVDLNGIRYVRDYNNFGIASDYGKNRYIHRVAQHDQILYQTERYALNTFGYSIPIDIQMEGDYVMVLKFSEVYFMGSGEKVFSVVLNGLTVVPHLDIFEEVGYSVAHDVYIEFQVFDSTLYWKNKRSRIVSNQIRVDFVKGEKDNPKINAIYVAHCTIVDIPKLPWFHFVQELHQYDSSQENDEASQYEELQAYIEEKKAQYKHPNNYRAVPPEPTYKWFSQYFIVIMFVLFSTALIYLTSNFA